MTRTMSVLALLGAVAAAPLGVGTLASIAEKTPARVRGSVAPLPLPDVAETRPEPIGNGVTTPPAERVEPPAGAAGTPSADAAEPDSAKRREQGRLRVRRQPLRRGETLGGLLARAGIGNAEALRAARALKSVFDPRALRAGERLETVVRETGDGGRELLRLAFRPAVDRRVVLRRDGGEFVAGNERVPHRRKVLNRAFRIEGSLFASAAEADVPKAVMLTTYRQLSHRIDFQREIRDGDRVALSYEQFRHPEEDVAHPGDLVAAVLERGSERIAVYRFETDDGAAGFYDASGVSVEATLARTPVRGARLSSLFGRRRHPVLGYTRMHRGMDFAAPRGTPVIAAGDGRVARASRYGSFGNYVRIRHDAELATAYAHLSRYADGIAPGVRVEQGDVIGYVGATGLATGPNLHYEVLLNGDQVNPRELDLPPSRTLTGAQLEAFQGTRERIDAAVREQWQEDESEVEVASLAESEPGSRSLE